MAPRRKQQRKNIRRPRIQWFRENGFVAIKAQESYSVGANGFEVPSDRSFRAHSITLHLTATKPLIVQCELMGPGSRPVWRCSPISVGVIPVRRTFRWPSSAAAMWPSNSADTVFKVVLPCPGKIFADAYVSCNYTVTLKLSADYDQQICPKQHGVITPLRNPAWEDLKPTDHDLAVRTSKQQAVRELPMVVREPTHLTTFDYDLADVPLPSICERCRNNTTIICSESATTTTLCSESTKPTEYGESMVRRQLLGNLVGDPGVKIDSLSTNQNL